MQRSPCAISRTAPSAVLTPPPLLAPSAVLTPSPVLLPATLPAALLAKASTAIILGFVVFLIVRQPREGSGCGGLDHCVPGSPQHCPAYRHAFSAGLGNKRSNTPSLLLPLPPLQGWICQSVVVFGFPFTPDYIWDIPVVTVILTLLPWSPLAKACGAWAGQRVAPGWMQA